MHDDSRDTMNSEEMSSYEGFSLPFNPYSDAMRECECPKCGLKASQIEYTRYDGIVLNYFSKIECANCHYYLSTEL